MDNLPQIEASFMLTGQGDYLEDITETLQLKPSKVRRKEGCRLKEFSSFMWELTTGKQYSKSVDFQSEELMKELQGKEDIILQLMDRCKLRSDLLIIIHAENGDGPEITLSKEIIQFAARVGAEIGFDIYFY